MARLILDTGLLIADVRGQVDLSVLATTDDLALPAIVIAEFLEGAFRSTEEGRRARLRTFLDGLVALMPVVD